MPTDWRQLPVLREDSLLWEDTGAAPLPGQIVPCLLCFKPFLMRNYTGVPDQICGACWDVYKDTAKVVCVKCKITICRALPKLLENGFAILPRMVLHTDKCNVCAPGLKMSTIIEIDEWQRHTREPKIIITGGKTK